MSVLLKIISFYTAFIIFTSSLAFAGSGGLDEMLAEQLKQTFRMQHSPTDEKEYRDILKRLNFIKEHKKEPNMHKIRGYIDELVPLEAYFVGEVLEDYYGTLGYLYRRDCAFEKAIECDIKLTYSPNLLCSWFNRFSIYIDGLVIWVRAMSAKMHGESIEENNRRMARYHGPFYNITIAKSDEPKGKKEDKGRRRGGGSAFSDDKLPWTIETQHEWARTLQKQMQELKDLDFNFSREMRLFEKLDENVRMTSESWLKKSQPSKRADERFHVFMDQISRLRAQALRDMANTSTSWLSIPYISRPSLAVAGNPNRQQALQDLEERQQRLKDARSRKFERRAPLQEDRKEKELEVEEETKEQVDVPVHFAGGKEGKFAQTLFDEAGTDTFGNFIQVQAAEMLSVFAVSRGIQDLVDNMYATGKSKSGLNLEKLHGENRWSIRVNDKYRICFNWDHEHQCWQGLWFGDYHKQK